MVRHRSWLLAVLVAAMLARSSVAGPPDPMALAIRINGHLEARWRADKIHPAPLAADAEFLRRAFLDLTGRIPSSADVHEFLADESAEKRGKLLERLLDDARFSVQFANVWRADLLPELASDRGAVIFKAGFEA